MEETNNLPAISQTDIAPMSSFVGIERFTALLNTEPPKEHVKKGPDKKSDEMPISYIEALLDEIYMRQWGTESISFSVVGNEICCDLILWVIDPQTKLRITRGGTAALPIMMDAVPDRLKFIAGDPEPEEKTKERNMWALDMQNKKPMALKLQRPAVKQIAIKNAAKSLGISFGRNLNRTHTDNPDAFYTDIENMENDLYQAKNQLKEAKTEDDFSMIWDTWESLHDVDDFKKEFMYQKRIKIRK